MDINQHEIMPARIFISISFSLSSNQKKGEQITQISGLFLFELGLCDCRTPTHACGCNPSLMKMTWVTMVITHVELRKA